MKILIIGCGAWGYTISLLLKEDNRNIIYVYDKNLNKLNSLQNLNFTNLKTIKNFSEIKNLNIEIICLVIPFKSIRETVLEIKDFYKNQIIVNLSKGIERETFKTASMIITEILNTNRIVTLTGPTHTEEVIKKIPSAIISASNDIKLAKKIQKIFNRNYFRVYTSEDIIGAEVGGAVKNVMAIASGISDGLGYGTNTKSALLTRGMNEILKLSSIYNCDKNTFFGLSGFGDLMTTCFSKFSRNRNFGELIGKGLCVSAALEKIKQIVEGYYTSKTLEQIKNKYKLSLPISDEVYKILFENKSPFISVNSLMTRKLRKE